MAPKKKVGLKRMDAAVDALVPMGFTRSLIRKTVNNLLKVYDGDAGWVFVEEASYKLVIDTILEEQEKALMKIEDACENREVAPELLASLTTTTNEEVGAGPSDAYDRSLKQISDAGETAMWKDVSCVNSDIRTEPINTGLSAAISENIREDGPSMALLGESKLMRRLPCYGWISDEEEEEKHTNVSRDNRIVLCFRNSGFPRRTRWDVR